METLLTRSSVIFRQLMLRKCVYKIEDIKQLFDDIIIYLNKIRSNKRKTDGMFMLTILSDHLVSVNMFRLFDHSILRNHQIFLYIKQTFEMLFIKFIHSSSVIMTKQEEACLDSISYLIVQLCLLHNEPVKLFYGTIPRKIFKVTKKPNMRDPTFDPSSQKTSKLTDKPNLKTARLPPNAPPARPIELTKCDIANVLTLKKFLFNFVSMLDETTLIYPLPQVTEDDQPQRKYRDFFLTQSFFSTLIRAIENLSQNEYSPFHIRYKIADRFVRLCSQLELVDILVNPIVKCLRSKNYRHALESVEINQTQLSPKQLFFLHECVQFIIQHDVLQQEHVVKSICKKIVGMTKTVFDKHFLTTNIDITSNTDGDRRMPMFAISSHLEFLYQLSIIPSAKEYFLNSSIVVQLLLILKQDELIKNLETTKYLFNADVAIIAYSLLLLCNLAYEKTVLLQLKQTNLKDICIHLRFVSDYTIKFASKTLIMILNADDVNENHEPTKLREVYIKYIDTISNKPKKYTRNEKSGYTTRIEIETKYTFLTDTFIEKLLQDIKKMSTEEYEPNVSIYKETNRRLRICSKQESTKLEVLLNPVITCLKSEYYMKSYKIINPNSKSSYYDYNHQELASKEIFYMRECPEFLCQHDYKRQKEIATSLCQLMLQNAHTIFDQHFLAVFNGDAEMRNSRIVALSFHIKLLSHIALTPNVRKYFLSTSIIDKIFQILESGPLLDSDNHVVETHIEIVRESLTLLYNLAFDNEIKAVFETKNLLSICRQFSYEQDELIRFTSQTICIMLTPKKIDVLTRTHILCQDYIKIMIKSSKEPRRPYQGVKLRGLMQNLEIIITDDTFQETIVKEKDGVSALVQCLFIKCSDGPLPKSFEKIRRFALNILWNILRSIYGFKACKQLKANDQFVEYILNVANQTAKKPKEIASSIIWKLGDERLFRLEHTEKERKRAERADNDDDGSASSDIDEQLATGKQLDNFNVFMSFSNHVGDKIICRKISGRLKAQNFRVYIKKSGTHRSEAMRKAAQKQKTIIFCLSNEFQKSKDCMAEIECASKYKCPFVPILTDVGFKPKGWLNHLIGEKDSIDFTQKNMKDAMQKLINEIIKLNEIG